MQAMRYFLDTHDRQHGTFPAQLTPLEFEAFYQQYEAACQAEGVIPLRTHLSYDEGQAFCLNLAPNAAAVERAHARVGLPYDRIVEVSTATPADTFLRRQS